MNGQTLEVRVARKWQEAQDICALEFIAADGGALPAFSAGAHVDVHLPGGLVRPYSLWNAPHERHRYRIAVQREAASRGGSAAVHDVVREGQALALGLPRNAFPLAPGRHPRLLLAGGIGITPLLSMAEHLLREGADFELHCAVRSLPRLAFRDHLGQPRWQGRVRVHADDGLPAQRLDVAALLAGLAAETHLYVCGPGGFMDAVLAAAREHGWPEDRLHWERFAAEPVAQAGDQPFEVQLGIGGRVLHVPIGRTAAQVMIEAGTGLLTSCEQGVCGTCLTRVLQGAPDHRDSFLTDEERAAGDCFLPCCSRARGGRLVVEC